MRPGGGAAGQRRNGAGRVAGGAELRALRGPDGNLQHSRFTTDDEGRVLLGGQKLLPNNAYPHGLRASVELTGYDEDEGKRIFTAVITVKDRGGDTLAQTELQVRQLNKPADTPQG